MSTSLARARKGEQTFSLPLNAHGDMTCVSCHVPVNGFTDNRIHFLDAGAPVKTPSLLGLMSAGRYFHDGRTSSLAEAVEGHALSLGVRLQASRIEELVAYLERVGEIPPVPPGARSIQVPRTGR